MPTRNEIKLCSDAMTLIGGNSINSFEDGTYEAEVAAASYEDKRDALLTLRPWDFNTRIAGPISQLVAVPDAKWSYQYQIPNDCLRILGVYLDDAGRSFLDYQIVEEKILMTNYDGSLYLQYQFFADVPDWPPLFYDLMKSHMKAEFIIPITEDQVKYRDFTDVADKYTSQVARSLAQASPPKRLGGRRGTGFPLTRRR